MRPIDADGLPKISIHAPLTGSDVLERFYMRPERGFQSTLPLRGATRRLRPTGCRIPNFNPRSPYGERLG